jgi:hypothetical protein
MSNFFYYALAFVVAIAGFTPVVWITASQIRKGNITAQILADGEAANAKILEMRMASMQANDTPMTDLTLEVIPSGLPPYQAVVTYSVTVRNVDYFKRGNIIPVKFDPAHPTRVAIVPPPP